MKLRFVVKLILREKRHFLSLRGSLINFISEQKLKTVFVIMINLNKHITVRVYVYSSLLNNTYVHGEIKLMLLYISFK